MLTGKIKRICETELGIVSQCCQSRQASRCSNQYLENVSLKVNVKVCSSCLHAPICTVAIGLWAMLESRFPISPIILISVNVNMFYYMFLVNLWREILNAQSSLIIWSINFSLFIIAYTDLNPYFFAFVEIGWGAEYCSSKCYFEDNPPCKWYSHDHIWCWCYSSTTWGGYKPFYCCGMMSFASIIPCNFVLCIFWIELAEKWIYRLWHPWIGLR